MTDHYFWVGRVYFQILEWPAMGAYLKAYLVGAQELVHILTGAYGVVPTTKHLVGNEVELTHFHL